MKTFSLNRTLEVVCVMVLLAAHFLLLKRIGIWQHFLTGAGNLWDFDIYYRISADVLRGAHPYQLPYMQTLGPPSVILPWLPWTMFSPTTAHSLFLLLSVLAAWLSCYLFMKRTNYSKKLLLSLTLSLVLLSSFPARYTLIVGQMHLLFLPMVVQLIFPVKKLMQNFSLWLLVVYKTFFVFCFIPLLKLKQLDLRSNLFVAVIFIFSFMVIKPRYYVDYLQNNLSSVVLAPSATNNIDYYNQSLRATMQRLGVADLYLYVYLILLFVMGVYLYRSANIPAAYLFSIIISPVLWQHYLVLVFPVMIFILTKVYLSRSLLAVWMLGFLLWWLEFPWIHFYELNWWLKIVASHYFVSLLFFLGLAIVTHNKEPQKLTIFRSSDG